MLLDMSISAQNYVEDCEVCCRPIQITYTATEAELERFSAEAIQDL